MKKLINPIISIVLLIIVLNTSLYAWYTNYYGVNTTDEVLLSSNSLYFASGNGSKDNPFEITEARHLYNLAWLQDLGYFNDDNAPYYFKITKNIDMSDLTKNNVQSPIPPIGIDEYPFIGVLNGNDYIIDCLYVSTDFSNINYIKPSDTVLSSHTETINENTIVTTSVGFFGIIGDDSASSSSTTNDTDSTESATVTASASYFYLNNVNIESTVSSTTVGLLAGSVYGNLSYAGVCYSKLTLSNSVTSDYTLVGKYDESSVSWTDKPGGVGYGASMDLEEIYNVVKAKTGSTKLEAGMYFPFKATDSTYETAAEDNMGFFIGGEINAYTATANKMDTTTYYYPAASNSVYTLPHTTTNSDGSTTTLSEPSDNIKSETFGKITESNTSYYCLRLQAKLDVNNNLVTIENTYVNGTKVDKLVVPRRCIWFKPASAGTLEFIMVNPGDGENFTLTKIKRATKGDYSSSMSIVNTLIETNNTGSLTTGNSNDIVINGEHVTGYSYSDMVYYFSVEITESDIEAEYEYTLSRDNGSNGAYFWYLDLGSNGSSTLTYTGAISNIDFVYYSGTTLITLSNDNYSASGVYFVISSSSGDIVLYFKREEETSDDTTTRKVHYYCATSGVLTPSGTTSNSASDSTLVPVSDTS